MSLSEDLVRHAIRLLGNPYIDQDPARFIDFRRAISASYYALFHCLGEAVVLQVAPSVNPSTANRIQRSLDHQEMRKVCRHFTADPLQAPLRELIGTSASQELQTVAVSFPELQQARHSADYDLEYPISWQLARECVERAVNAIGAWNRVASSAEANVFILSLLHWKIWERERR